MKKVSVECKNICLSYGNNEVLKNINIKIEPGEFFALLGPSGSGKSTLLRLVAGFNQHNAGQLLLDGHDITHTPPHKRNIGMVFQSYALWPHLSVWDNVAFGLVERKLPSAQIREKTATALELVGLSQFAKRRPNELSGGQQQRVAIARAIAMNPSLILADEPTGNLDSESGAEVLSLLTGLNDQGATVIIITHDYNTAKKARRIVRISAGRIEYDIKT